MRMKKEINVQIGEQIKSAREAVRMTQEALAERIDVSPQYISDLERGVVGVSVATLKRLCLALGVSSDRILFGAPSETEFSAISEQCRKLSVPHRRILREIVEKYLEALSASEQD